VLLDGMLPARRASTCSATSAPPPTYPSCF
jgi:hypothetical protein